MVANFFFALALSMDGLGMGLAYGLRKIQISFFPLLIICTSSGLAILFSMICGGMLGAFLEESVASVLGACILILVGLWIILQNYFLNLVGPRLCRIEAQRLELVLNILKEPVRADLNRSGEIDVREAVFLGIALAMDALGAGFGAALAGYSLLWTPILVAVVEFLMINLGLLVGGMLSLSDIKKPLTVIPGLIIVILGLAKLFRQ